jgi:hypothetical protein
MKLNRLALIVIGALIAVTPVVAQDKAKQTQNASMTKVATGQKSKIAGVIVKREADTFVLRDINGADVQVMINNFTKVEEKKSNIFRGAKNYNTTMLAHSLLTRSE